MDGDWTGHHLSCGAGLSLAKVTDNQDAEGRGRLKVRVLPLGAELWAALVVPSAGKSYGVAFFPKLGEIVLLAFITPDQPVILGALWSGKQSEPGHAAPAEDRYS